MESRLQIFAGGSSKLPEVEVKCIKDLWKLGACEPLRMNTCIGFFPTSTLQCRILYILYNTLSLNISLIVASSYMLFCTVCVW